jgi:hypothetical protein
VRDVGLVVWVALLFIGVVGSMISSLRRQAQPRPQARGELPQRREMPPVELAPQLRRVIVQAPASPAPQRKPPPVPGPAGAPPPIAAPPPGHDVILRGARRRRLFSHRGDIVRAVIAAEVLGKPRGLSDEYRGV